MTFNYFYYYSHHHFHQSCVSFTKVDDFNSLYDLSIVSSDLLPFTRIDDFNYFCELSIVFTRAAFFHVVRMDFISCDFSVIHMGATFCHKVGDNFNYSCEQSETEDQEVTTTVLKRKLTTHTVTAISERCFPD